MKGNMFVAKYRKALEEIASIPINADVWWRRGLMKHMVRAKDIAKKALEDGWVTVQHEDGREWSMKSSQEDEK